MHGSSITSARLTRTNRSPRLGDSRRASATSDPTDRTASLGALTGRDSDSACTERACVADAVPFSRSSWATSSTRSRSLSDRGSTAERRQRNSATHDDGATGATASESVVTTFARGFPAMT